METEEGQACTDEPLVVEMQRPLLQRQRNAESNERAKRLPECNLKFGEQNSQQSYDSKASTDALALDFRGGENFNKAGCTGWLSKASVLLGISSGRKSSGERLHRNITLMMYFRVLNAISYAARNAALFDAYLHMQFGGHRAIGTMASLTGMVTVFVAPLAGYLSDASKNNRTRLLEMASVFGFFCAGQRSRLFVQRRIWTTLANGCGPLFSLWVFVFYGNVWQRDILSKVLLLGVLLSIPQLFVLLMWKDITVDEAERIRQCPTAEKDCFASAEKQGQDSHFLQNPKGDLFSQRKFMCFRTSHVPWLIFASHCITFCGAGMTVKYFPLFFKAEYAFKPIHSCLLSAGYTLTIAVATYVIQKASAFLGRTEASFFFTSVGVGGLFLLARTYSLPLVVTLYLIRGGFQNASTPIDRSICCDLIPPALSGRWAALQSLAAPLWAASAFLGGFLADETDFRTIFIYTGCIYIIAQLVYVPCLWLLPSNGISRGKSKRASNGQPRDRVVCNRQFKPIITGDFPHRCPINPSSLSASPAISATTRSVGLCMQRDMSAELTPTAAQ